MLSNKIISLNQIFQFLPFFLRVPFLMHAYMQVNTNTVLQYTFLAVIYLFSTDLRNNVPEKGRHTSKHAFPTV